MSETKKRPIEEIDHELAALVKEEARIKKRIKAVLDESSEHPDYIIRKFKACDSIPQNVVEELVRSGRLTKFKVDYESGSDQWHCAITLDGTNQVFGVSHESDDDDDDDEGRWNVPIDVEKLKTIRPSKRFDWLSARHGVQGWTAFKLAWLYFFDTMYFTDE
jgi:hypothetical protein